MFSAILSSLAMTPHAAVHALAVIASVWGWGGA